MAFHWHWVELCMFESDLAELHQHLLAELKAPTVCTGLCKTFTALWFLSNHWFCPWLSPCWTFLAFWGWWKCSCSHMTISLLLLKTPVKIPCYELEVAFITGVCCCQHHFNVPETQIFWRLKSSFFFSCAVHMDLMLAWSHLQVSTLYSHLSPGIIAVAK